MCIRDRYIGDTGNDRIQKWILGQLDSDDDGEGDVCDTDDDGDGVSDDVDICPDTPNGEAVDANGCSDSQKDTDGDGVTDDVDNCPTVANGPSTEGTTVAGGNGNGSSANKLSFPRGIALDVSGNMYIGDRANNRVQKWEAGASKGTTVAGGNGQGSAANQLSNPAGIALDASGNMYIVCLLYTSPSPRDRQKSRMPSSA